MAFEPLFDFEKMNEACCKALRFAFRMRRQNEMQDIPWTGPHYEAANHASPADALKAENMDYAMKDQGRDALTEIVSVILQLGYEQGQRAKTRYSASELLDRTSGAKFTVKVGYEENNTSVHTESGILSNPAECLARAIEALSDEQARVANCPRQRFIMGEPK